MDFERFNIKKEENWGFLSLTFGIISYPLILLFPLYLITSFLGFVLGLVRAFKSRGFGWDSEKKLALFGVIVSAASIIINIVLFVIGVSYINSFG